MLTINVVAYFLSNSLPPPSNKDDRYYRKMAFYQTLMMYMCPTAAAMTLYAWYVFLSQSII